MRISIPRWVQLVLIPVAVFLAIYFARVASQAVFIFIVAAIVALLLNPVVLAMKRIRAPRWLAVPVVYLVFVAVVVLIFVFFGPPLVRQFQRLFEAIPGWLDDLNNLLANLQGWLAKNNVSVNLRINTTDIVNWLQSHSSASLGAIFSVGRSVVSFFIDLFLVIVISFYMLIDGKRVFRFLVRLAGGTPEVKEEYVRGLQTSFSKYVRGQALLGATIGLASGLAIWILSWDVVHVWPEGGQYALLFGFWAGITEVIPYVGPFLGALPPVIAAFFHSPLTAVWIIVLFVVVQQLESHILAPNIVASSVGVHPLVVIFALLAGAQIGGIIGMLVTLPLLAMLKHTLTFYQFKFSHAPWAGDDGIALIPARSGAPPPRRVPTFERPPQANETRSGAFDSPTEAFEKPSPAFDTPPGSGEKPEE